MTGVNTAQAPFFRQLQLLWSAEALLVEALPKLLQKATALGLRKSLAMHLAETDQHKVVLAAYCKLFEIPSDAEPNADLQAILREGDSRMANMAPGQELDAAIIKGAVAVEDYEIAAYAKIAEAARELGYEGISKRLYLTREEEVQAHTKLKFMADHLIGQLKTEFVNG